MVILMPIGANDGNHRNKEVFVTAGHTRSSVVIGRKTVQTLSIISWDVPFGMASYIPRVSR